MMNFHRDVYCILGLPFDAVNLDKAVDLVRQSALNRRRLFLSTPNLNFLIGCIHDVQFRDSVIQSDLSLVDGMPLVWIAKLLGIPINVRIAGSDLFNSLRTEYDGQMSVYFFGGPDGVASDACLKLNSENKGLTCVGFYSPGFGSVLEMSGESIIDNINNSNPDFVVVSLGAKKGQAWIMRNQSRIISPLVSHLGAVVNFVAGRILKAPPWIGRFGLEWLWRIKEEPVLWRRYFKDGLVIIRLFLTRILPYYLYLLLHRPNTEELKLASVNIIQSDNICIIKLKGSWAHQNIASLRNIFSAAISFGVDVEIEMSQVTYIDSAVIGLVLLLHGYLKKIDKKFRIMSPSKSVSRVLKFSCTQYLL